MISLPRTFQNESFMGTWGGQLVSQKWGRKKGESPTQHTSAVFSRMVKGSSLWQRIMGIMLSFPKLRKQRKQNWSSQRPDKSAVVIKLLYFILKTLGNHWRILSRGVTCSHVCWRQLLWLLCGEYIIASQKRKEADELGGYCSVPCERQWNPD